MKTTKFILAMGLGVALFTSCKKDDPAPTNAEKIQARWNFDKVASYYSFMGATGRDTTFGVSGDFAEFRNDGKVYSLFAGERDTSTYMVYQNDKLILDTDTFNITTLTNNNLQLFSRSTDATGFEEVTVFMNK